MENNQAVSWPFLSAGVPGSLGSSLGNCVLPTPDQAFPGYTVLPGCCVYFSPDDGMPHRSLLPVRSGPPLPPRSPGLPLPPGRVCSLHLMGTPLHL